MHGVCIELGANILFIFFLQITASIPANNNCSHCLRDNPWKCISVAVVSSIAASTCLLGVVVGATGSSLGFIIKKKCFQHHGHSETEVPVYEDLSLEQKVKVSLNIAYEDVRTLK